LRSPCGRAEAGPFSSAVLAFTPPFRGGGRGRREISFVRPARGVCGAGRRGALGARSVLRRAATFRGKSPHT
jgi:hypothetical protein